MNSTLRIGCKNPSASTEGGRVWPDLVFFHSGWANIAQDITDWNTNATADFHTSRNPIQAHSDQYLVGGLSRRDGLRHTTRNGIRGQDVYAYRRGILGAKLSTLR